MNMHKQWSDELRILKRARNKIERDLHKELKRIQREVYNLERAAIRANNSSVKQGSRIDRRIAILEGRLA